MKNKKIFIFILLIAILTQSTMVLGADMYPKHTTEQTTGSPEITKTIALVYSVLDEDNMANIMLYATAGENIDLYLYPVGDALQPLLLKPTKECSELVFPKYLTGSKDDTLVNAKLSEALEMLNSKTTEKELYICAGYGFISGDMFENRETLQNLFASYPDVSVYSSIDLQIDKATDVSMYDHFSITNLGYDYCSEAHKTDGRIKISAGKADKNMLVVARADKSELLYISGYMATSDTVAKYATTKTIKGVSLGYNNIYITKTNNPKNLAYAMFTITDEVGNTATDAFEVIVKNEDSYAVYYKNTPGVGMASAKTAYDKTQDDAVPYVGHEKQYTPSVMTKEEAKELSNDATSNSLFGLEEPKEETSWAKAWSIIKSVLSTVWLILWLIIRVLLFIFVALMAFHKKFRGNVMTKVYGSKYGPWVQRIQEKLIELFNTYFVSATKKVKGNASLQGKFVFISHASIDMKRSGSIVAALVAELESKGVKCWTSEAGIGGSEDYNTVLPQAIKKCAMMLLFLSPNSVVSTEVESEAIAAKRERKTIFPVQIAEFDLFADEKWEHILTQYQVKPLMTSNPVEVEKIAESIKKVYDNL